jgi:murein peptide amidase A
MNALVNAPTASPAPPRPARRSLAGLLDPLDRLAANSASLIARHDAQFKVEGERYTLPRYLYIGPHAGNDPIRIGLFAAIHGDEPAGAFALAELLQILEANPALAAGYCLFVYPVTNPTGFEDNTRQSRRGRDLNREFWNNSKEPEVLLLQSELVAHAFHGIISLHADDTSHGLYGFVRGATLTRNLIEPALTAAEQWLPRNEQSVIDGFAARNGVIRKGYQGILSAPPKVRPRPFEIILETPLDAPQFRQHKALVAAMLSILAEYRKLLAYAPNL